MKKVLAVLVALNAALLAGVLLKEKDVVVHAASGGGTPVGNGDVNGDGFINITDVIGILDWMFLGGDAPVAIGLPATGQTNCFDWWTGAEIACDSAYYPGQDGFYKAGCPSEGRFTDNGDGTVTDNCTGLMWQKETARTYTWQEALQYCEGLSLGDHSDWRLPNVRELQSIVDYGRVDPAIDRTVFGAVSRYYWSSSTYVSYPGPTYAWSVNFYNGLVDYVHKGVAFFVRAVRSGP